MSSRKRTNCQTKGHDFMPVSVKRFTTGPWVLPATYHRCVECGYREVEHYVFALGEPNKPILKREPV
jgi:hypothetical protein